jgi:tRNA-modifying protein YgfZ
MAAFWCEIPRDVVMVQGEDAQSYLHGQLSQDLRELAVGQSAHTLVLDPTGKVLCLARVLRSGDTAYVLDTDAGFGEGLIARLARFKIRVKAEISEIPWRCIALRSTGDETVALAAAGGAVAVPAWWGDGSAIDLLGPAPQAPAEIPEATTEQYEYARIAAGWPAMGSEIVPGETIPAALGEVVQQAVSFTKGCYPGQELVERMDSRGAAAPQVLRAVEVAAGTAVGDPVLVDGEPVGHVTSVAGTRALALVKRSAPV